LFTEALSKVNIALFAVDEAHRLSQWGHDFRPDYLRLGQAVENLGRPQVLALTATATPEVRADIQGTLKLRDPFVSVRGFSRPNLSLHITHTERVQAKYDRLRDIVKQWQTGIVYCATRKKVEEVAAMLDEWRLKAIAYHGGMDEKERAHAQNRFMEKKVGIAVATNAFGMGIDRSDVRFVAHFEVPGSIEAYYQEAGRAGRDGEPSHCELFFNYADTRTQEFFIDGSNPTFETIRDVYQALLSWADSAHEVHASIEDVADRASVKNSMAVSSALSLLGRQGYIERFDIPGKRIRGTRLLRPDVLARNLDLDRKAIAEKDKRDRAKLKAMVEMCYADKCRQVNILQYFGEPSALPCGNCDACKRSGLVSAARVGTAEEIEVLRKALSGVARMCRKEADGTWTPRFGKGRIIAMLTGSRSREVLEARLDELSTYGLLKSAGSPALQSLFKEMEQHHLIETVKLADHPLVTLTTKGAEVMRLGTTLRLNWPDLRKQPPSEPPRGTKPVLKEEGGIAAAELGFDEKLFEKLKQKRAEIAKRESVPTYAVFHTNTLEFFTRLKPKSVEAALKIRSVSEQKVAKWLPEFLEVIQRHA
ncbi:MAG: RecQ family ATP-dependent DNA helicase, partial [Roseimicrobium sp.]